jgi:CheY-like chemotaxis protein
MATGTAHGAVLIVEDDPHYLELLEEAFAGAGFRTFRADNGEKALEVLRSHLVDLVVSDFIMPELNGLELCRLLTEDLQFAGVKMILYSCNTDSSFRRRARELGAIDYLPKSDDTEALVRHVCEITGIEAEQPRPPAPPEALTTVSARATQLRLLFENVLDLLQIATVSEAPSPATRVAWDAAQRSSGEIRRLLRELEAATPEPPEAPGPKTASLEASTSSPTV